MSSQALNTSIALNIAQNSPDFKLEAIEDSVIIFKKGLFSKTLDPPKADPENINNYRSVTIKCLYKGCK